MTVTKEQIEKVVKELVGEEALPIIFYLRGKTRISEFIIAEELELEIHYARNLLYRLLEHNIVSFLRKKDKIKGWYICYWDFNENMIPFLERKIREQRLAKLKERLAREEQGQFYLCRNACARMDFDNAMEFNFKCPECGELMNLQDNTRTREFLKQKIKELEEELKEEEEREKKLQREKEEEMKKKEAKDKKKESKKKKDTKKDKNKESKKDSKKSTAKKANNSKKKSAKSSNSKKSKKTGNRKVKKK